MDFLKFIAENHHSIAAQWTQTIINTYPDEGAKFFATGKSQFSNPVGHVFQNNISQILKQLYTSDDIEVCRTDLDGILRIRAVQGFSPSVALCFLPALKEIVRREMVKVLAQDAVDALLYDWNLKVDRLTMLGFDLYMACREILWQQKANQLYSRTHRLLEKANLLKDEEVAG